ncbi:MAG: hypothetical protein IKR64_02955 [Treponema sp.]|nr:hypothetical protein [Treponema sp.]
MFIKIRISPYRFYIFIILIFFNTCIYLNAQSLNDYDNSRYALPGEAAHAGKYRKQILDTLDKTKKYATDIDNNGEINCIDYACIFKLLWDKQYDPKNCEIVKNKSKTMNHLFVRTRQYAGVAWECIEPQAALKDINNYFMEDFWPSNIYNPIYNNYEEASYWLNYAKKHISF